jgi:acyl-CoA reductase-like NAD-dependent aldehyde dehydrogenase
VSRKFLQATTAFHRRRGDRDGQQHAVRPIVVHTDKGRHRAHRIAAALEAGEVLINGAPNFAVHRPFGGIGISGVDKEGGRAGFDEFLRIKSVAISLK